MSTLPVQTLDFNEIHSNFIEYLKNQDTFKGYNFDGTNLSILLRQLEYATYYNGFYAHQLANESFIESAGLKTSILSKGKFNNYIPQSRHAAIANVKFHIDIDAENEPSNKRFTIVRGSAIKSTNIDIDSRTFVVLDDVHIYNTSSTGYEYISEVTPIYEGSFRQYRFLADGSLVKQRFVIKDKNIDIRTLRVDVYESEGSTNRETFTKIDNWMTVTKDSPIYILSTNDFGEYELLFGNNSYGKALKNGNFVICSYVKTSGPDGNNAKTFRFEGDYTFNGNPFLISVETIDPSYGGLYEESIDELKFNIIHHYRRQNRTLHVNDYKSIIVEKFRNVNSINVWGGEENVPKYYGRTFISIKPIYGDKLSDTTKSFIKNNILNGYNIPSDSVEFVDPDMLYLNLEVDVKYNPLTTSKSRGELVTLIQNTISYYNNTELNRFDSYYSDSLLNGHIIDAERSILSSETRIKLMKNVYIGNEEVSIPIIDYSNKIEPSSIKSNTFTMRGFNCYTFDKNGKIRVMYYNDTWKEFEEDFGVVDYEKGIIIFTNFNIRTTENDFNITATPYFRDFFTLRNNIIDINETMIKLTDRTNSIEFKK